MTRVKVHFGSTSLWDELGIWSEEGEAVNDILDLASVLYGDVEAWGRSNLGEKIKFYFDVCVRCLLHIRLERKNRQMDEIWSLEEQLG